METFNGLLEADVIEQFAKFATEQQVVELNESFATWYPDLKTLILDDTQNKAMLGLMRQNCPIRLGMPAYLVEALIHDSESRYNADILMGQNPTEMRPFIDTYRDLRGYQFSWGVLTQEQTYRLSEDNDNDNDNDNDMRECTNFGFSFEFVLRLLPRPDLWRNLTRLYRFPELKYELWEKTMEMTLLEFSSSPNDLPDEDRLRKWLAREFIPQHLPGLFSYLCLWLVIHLKFPAIFDKMVDVYSLQPGYAALLLAAIKQNKSLKGTAY